MPAVHLGTKAKQEASKTMLRKMITRKMAGEYNQTTLGAEFGISQPAMGKKIEKDNFTHIELIKLFKLLRFTDEEILKVMKGE